MSKYYAIKKVRNPAKAKAWKYFSKYIRLRDALKTTGTTTHCRCITCNEVKPFEEMDAGHAIPGRSNAILFSELICNSQCQKCNRFGGGELQAYKRILVDKFGQNMWDYWQSTKSIHVDYSSYDYEQIAKTYREKVKRLI